MTLQDPKYHIQHRPAGWMRWRIVVTFGPDYRRRRRAIGRWYFTKAGAQRGILRQQRRDRRTILKDSWRTVSPTKLTKDGNSQ